MQSLPATSPSCGCLHADGVQHKYQPWMFCEDTGSHRHKTLPQIFFFFTDLDLCVLRQIFWKSDPVVYGKAFGP